MGGEEAVAERPAFVGDGLPPRGRGRALSRKPRPRIRRITPAWAGKSQHSLFTEMGKRDYPRVGGEEADIEKPDNPSVGLPPRGRGRDLQVRRWRKLVGITPAWAGKRPVHAKTRETEQDYPRVGGEER